MAADLYHCLLVSSYFAQGMLDFDFMCKREKPSVACMVFPFSGNHYIKFYWGTVSAGTLCTTLCTRQVLPCTSIPDACIKCSRFFFLSCRAPCNGSTMCYRVIPISTQLPQEERPRRHHLTLVVSRRVSMFPHLPSDISLLALLCRRRPSFRCTHPSPRL